MALQKFLRGYGRVLIDAEDLTENEMRQHRADEIADGKARIDRPELTRFDTPPDDHLERRETLVDHLAPIEFGKARKAAGFLQDDARQGERIRVRELHDDNGKYGPDELCRVFMRRFRQLQRAVGNRRYRTV